MKIEHKLLFQSEQREYVTTPVGYVDSEDLSDFVCNLLDQYEEEGLLTWHKNTIPSHEVWVKIGGDYVGDSLKLWKGKRIRVFLFGDYDFELKVCGITGAQSVHPCLWCKTSKEQMQVSQSDQPEIPERTVKNIKQDHRQYKLHGGGGGK